MLSFLFPSYCVGCQKTGAHLCDECISLLQVHSEICPYCHQFSQQGVTCRDCRQLYPDGLDGLIVGFRYHKSIKKAILKLKYGHTSTLAPTLAYQLKLHLISHPGYERMGSIMCTDIPNHRWRRHMIKGYNQSTLLAKEIAKQCNVPFVSLARRIKHTTQQTKLSQSERRENLMRAFSPISHNLKKYQTIIIVDDVTTTGSTLHHVCATIKKHHLHKRVRGLVIARQGR